MVFYSKLRIQELFKIDLSRSLMKFRRKKVCLRPGSNLGLFGSEALDRKFAIKSEKRPVHHHLNYINSFSNKLQIKTLFKINLSRNLMKLSGKKVLSSVRIEPRILKIGLASLFKLEKSFS